jgi:hypothetical protein
MTPQGVCPGFECASAPINEIVLKKRGIAVWDAILA